MGRKISKRTITDAVMELNARTKSNNPYVKLDENDAVAKFNKKYFVEEIPEYKRR